MRFPNGIFPYKKSVTGQDHPVDYSHCDELASIRKWDRAYI